MRLELGIDEVNDRHIRWIRDTEDRIREYLAKRPEWSDERIARHDDFAALGKRIEHEKHGGGTVVDDQCIFCPSSRAQRLTDCCIARTALAG